MYDLISAFWQLLSNSINKIFSSAISSITPTVRLSSDHHDDCPNPATYRITKITHTHTHTHLNTQVVSGVIPHMSVERSLR